MLLTTHDLDDVEAPCRRVLVINHGRVLADTSLEGVCARPRAERRLVVELEHERHDPVADGLRLVERTGTRVTLAFDALSSSAPRAPSRSSRRRRRCSTCSWYRRPSSEVVARYYEERRP